MAPRSIPPLVLALAAAAVWIACDKSPLHSTPLGESLTGVTIAGPASVAPGATLQFVATAHYADGTTKDVTATAQWYRLNYDILELVSAGTFRGRARGETDVWVTYPTPRESPHVTVLVLEPDLYKLSGRVLDRGGDTVYGATVEVETGTGVGVPKRNTYDGGYVLYGVAGDIQLKVGADDTRFIPQRVNLHIDQHTTKDFTLDTAVPAIDISGSWTLSISAQESCQSVLPEAARHRDYKVTITQHAGAYFGFGPANSTTVKTEVFEGRIFGNDASVTIEGGFDSYYGGYYDLLDRLGTLDLIGVYGRITGTAGASEITGRFEGAIDYYKSPTNGPYFYERVGSCTADTTLVLRR